MIGIIDYGVGNVQAFATIYRKLDIPHTLARTTKDISSATRLILPGVGVFDDTMTRFNESGLREAIEHRVIGERIPILGICVGMQMLAFRSEEGELPGLGWVKGNVRRMDVARLSHRTRLPHMGWNDVVPRQTSTLFEGLQSDACFYFLHSYCFECAEKGNVLAESDYGGSFCCAVGSNNVYGVQFHPEKSHHVGSRLLKNFAEL